MTRSDRVEALGKKLLTLLVLSNYGVVGSKLGRSSAPGISEPLQAHCLGLIAAVYISRNALEELQFQLEVSIHLIRSNGSIYGQ